MHRRARGLASVALLVAIATGALACSGSDDPDRAEADGKRPPAMIVDYRKQRHDVGRARDLERLVNLLARMQQAFQAGDMSAVCRDVSRSWLSQFPPNARREDAPCRVKLSEFARRLQRRGATPRKLTIVWTRIYYAIAGITVSGGDLSRFRIPFAREGDAWKLQLGVFPEPEVLNDTLELS